jgi:ribosomal protein S18 acetylase RimI-like enzyme
MTFQLGSATSLSLKDEELSSLLQAVYVQGGYTDPERAALLFQPATVRSRGDLICARESQSGKIAGMVMVVFSHSPSRILARADECEMHLLAVVPDYRQQGLGLILIKAALYRAQMAKQSRLLLWTQTKMLAAHKLYHRAGFERKTVHDFSRGGRKYCFYQRDLKVKTDP